MKVSLGRILLTAGALGVFALAAPARADFIVQLAGPPAPVAGGYQYNYNLVFSAIGDSFELADGDFATIYDIEGLVSVTAPAGFTFTAQNVGVDAFQTAPTDNPALPNVTFIRDGGLVSSNATFVATIVSKYGLTKLASYTTQETNVTGGTTTPKGNVGTVQVATVPEPGSIALLSLGVAGMLGLRRRRRPRSA